MKIIQNTDSFKLAAVGNIKLLFNRLPLIVGKDKQNRVTPLDLNGLGHTSKNKDSIPWLVTCSTTRASYIILQGEAMSSSYVYEKFHLYDWALAKDVANVIAKLLELNKPVPRPTQQLNS